MLRIIGILTGAALVRPASLELTISLQLLDQEIHSSHLAAQVMRRQGTGTAARSVTRRAGDCTAHRQRRPRRCRPSGLGATP